MVGIIAYSVYIPRYRLKREAIFQGMGWFNPGIKGVAKGEMAVANYDEDSLTMAVAAGRNAFSEIDHNKINALYLASTSLPYKERGNAAIANEALNLSSKTRTADFSGSPRAGTSALISAFNEAGSQTTLVCGSDCRLGKPGGTQEELYGDGAAALIVGTDGLMATMEGHYSLSYDFPDQRRIDGNKFSRSWEERWIREAGYGKMIPEAINGLLTKCGLRIQDVSKVVYPPLTAKDHAEVGKSLGLTPDKAQGSLVEEVGNTGCAHPLMMLVGALEEAKPGDKIVVASYGSGSDAILFQVTDKIKGVKKRAKLKTFLGEREELKSYEKYLSFRGITKGRRDTGRGDCPHKSLLTMEGKECDPEAGGFEM